MNERDQAGPCATCGEPFNGEYCPRCGERRLHEADWSVRRFLADAIATFTDLDSRVFRTFGALLFRPGLLTREYFAGRRTLYLKPLQVFVICNILYFLLQPLGGFDTLTTRLYTHYHSLPYSQQIRPLVHAAAEARGVDVDEYGRIFDTAVATQARTLVIIMAPLLALFLALIHLGRRRWFVEHLVFAVHFLAFFLLLLLAIAGAIRTLDPLLARYTPGLREVLFTDRFVSSAMLALIGRYGLVAFRASYGHGLIAATIRAFLFIFAVMITTQLYRAVLFFTTYYSL